MRKLSDWLPAERLKGTPSEVPGRYASGTLWPHGEWSLGYGSERPDGGDWHEDVFVGMGVEDTEAAREAAGDALASLNLSDASNSTSRPPRGLKGITGYGQQMIKACGYLMQRHWPHHRKTLGTVTLPPMTREQRAEVVQLWPDLTRELLRWLSRRLSRQGVPPVVCSVTEIQPKRLQAQGEGCLHWHLLWLNVPAKSGCWSVNPNEMRAWLVDLLERKIGGLECGHVNVNTKPVKGEVAAYLAKYMSKGKQLVQEALADWGADNCPRTWYNLTKPARDMVKASTHRGRVPGALLESVLNHAWDVGPGEVYAFLRHIDLVYDGVAYTAGWRGRLHAEVAEDLHSMLESGHMPRLPEDPAVVGWE